MLGIFNFDQARILTTVHINDYKCVIEIHNSIFNQYFMFQMPQNV